MRFKLLAVLLLLANVCYAGSAPASDSSVNGYFLGFQDEAYVSAGSEKTYLNDLKSVCKKGGQIWALGYTKPLKCTALTRIEEGGDGPVFQVELKGLETLKDASGAILFSTKKFAEKSWVRREATPEEATEVYRTLNGTNSQLHLVANGAISRFLFNRRPTVVEAGNTSIYLVPWAVTEDDTGSVNNEYAILKRGDSGLEYTGAVTGKILGFVDITGDGFPELKISQDCDGRCEYVVDVRDGTNMLVSIFNH